MGLRTASPHVINAPIWDNRDVSNPDSVLDRIDGVVTDWHGSRDSMRWRPNVIEEIDQRQREHLAAVARLVAEHTGTAVEKALDAVKDVNEHGPDGHGWPLCFQAMRMALEPHIAPILAKVPPDAQDEALRKLIPSMVSAFVQMAHRCAA